jgi:hypothetical protein
MFGGRVAPDSSSRLPARTACVRSERTGNDRHDCHMYIFDRREMGATLGAFRRYFGGFATDIIVPLPFRPSPGWAEYEPR